MIDNKWKREKAAIILLLVASALLISLAAGGVSASDEGNTPAAHVTDSPLDEHGGVAGEETSAHEEGGHEKYWWQFTGWEALFAFLSCVYFRSAITALPKILEKKSPEVRH